MRRTGTLTLRALCLVVAGAAFAPAQAQLKTWRHGIVEAKSEGVKVLARRVPSLPVNELRNLADTFRGKLKSGVVLLGTELEGKVTLLAAVTSDVVARVSAHDLAQTMAPKVQTSASGWKYTDASSPGVSPFGTAWPPA